MPPPPLSYPPGNFIWAVSGVCATVATSGMASQDGWSCFLSGETTWRRACSRGAGRGIRPTAFNFTEQTMKMTDGMKSSEFWVTAVGPGLVMILNNVFGWGVDWQSLMAMFMPASAYAVSRGMVKSNQKGKR